MPSVATRLRNRAVTAAFPALFRVDERRSDLIRLGTPYGGWWVPESLLGPESVCYLGGIGTDISFDLAMIERFGCRVWGIDPTPKALDWLADQTLPEQFSFLPVGLAGERGELKFFLPENPEHVSASVKNLQNTGDFFTAPVQTIAQTMEALGHDHVDLVKLDIEGAEHETIRRMLADGIHPKVLLVEYDQPEPVAWPRATTRLLRENGYRLVKLEKLNLTFVRHEEPVRHAG
ncbi:FkbM family methyltransferase [Aeromicrobium duanguangcaii]|uniref:FkbM family methyltransferase n=1 Tax=Aeromicrobium duanguangcaii TaxID=2968086 RepID=UPI002017ED70|nr:FkbM family methyltransferase [Aeromicrobium duanguangcaii]